VLRRAVITTFAGFVAMAVMVPSIWAAQSGTSQSSLPGIGGNPVWVALKLFVSLALLIVLVIFTIRFLAKRGGLGAVQGEVRVLAARQLAPGRSVQVIEAYGTRLLVGVGDQVTVLATLDAKEETNTSFADLLAQRLGTLRVGHGEGESTES
jgi:flagellar protein FliO/FliZ